MFERRCKSWFVRSCKKRIDIELLFHIEISSIIWASRFSQDGLYIAVGGTTGALIYDTETGTKLCRLKSKSWVYCVAFSLDGKCLATGEKDGKIKIWDIMEQRVRKTFEGHQDLVRSLEFSPDNCLLVSGSWDGTVRVWDVETGRATILKDDRDRECNSVAFSPDGRLVAAGIPIDKSNCCIWDVQTGNLKLVEDLSDHMDTVWSVAFTPDGESLVIGRHDGTVKIWDISSLVHGMAQHALDALPPVTRTGDRSDSDYPFVEEGTERRIRCTHTLSGRRYGVKSVAVSADSRWVISAADREVKIWDREKGKEELELLAHYLNSSELPLFCHVRSVEFSPAGGIFSTADASGHVKIWRYTED